MKRQREAHVEREDIFDLIAALPQFDPNEKRPEENRNGSWSARLLVLHAIGHNTRATHLFDLEREWEKRRDLLANSADLAGASRLLSGAVRYSLVEFAAALVARRGRTRDGSRPIVLPAQLENRRLEWEGAVEEFFTVNVGAFDRLLEQLWKSHRLERALRGVRVVGADTLNELILALSRTDGNVAARGHACRLCGDVGCAVHCAPSRTGKHHARRREGVTVCSHCGQQAETASLGFGRWRPTSGDPVTWFDDTPLSPEEVFFARMDDLAAGRAEEA